MEQQPFRPQICCRRRSTGLYLPNQKRKTESGMLKSVQISVSQTPHQLKVGFCGWMPDWLQICSGHLLCLCRSCLAANACHTDDRRFDISALLFSVAVSCVQAGTASGNAPLRHADFVVFETRRNGKAVLFPIWDLSCCWCLLWQI